jgi:hypothetical protein
MEFDQRPSDPFILQVKNPIEGDAFSEFAASNQHSQDDNPLLPPATDGANLDSSTP